jgi:hypothetical protein
MRPSNPALYARVKRLVNKSYKKPSAYRSMAYMKEYKRRGGLFLEDGTPRNLTRWMKEKWRDVNPKRTKHSYPVFRPTKRISRKTPLTLHEIPRRVLLKQSRKKQRIQGKHNLPSFKSLFRSFTRKISRRNI